MISDLVKAVVEDFPEDRNVVHTMDPVKFYRINFASKTLYVPEKKVLRVNMLELDRFIEAVRSFAVADLESSIYNWTDLNLEEYAGENIRRGLERLEEVLVPGTMVGVDIEARRVEWKDNKVLSIGFAYNDNSSIALYDFPLEGGRGPWNGSFIPNWILIWLQHIFSRRDITWVWHNGKFDCGRLEYLNSLIARVDEDTMLMHYAQINERKGTHGLKELGAIYLQAPNWDDELDKYKRDWCKANKVKLGDFMYDSIPTSVLIPYMQRDCIATRRLVGLFRQMARPGSDFIYRKLVEASDVYKRVELNGLQVGVDYLEDLEWELEKELKVAEKHLQEVAGKIWDPIQYGRETGANVKVGMPFNPSSPKQLKWMLSQVMGYQVQSTDAATMEFLLDELEHGHVKSEIAKEFLEAIGVARQKGKYMDTYVQGTREALCSDNRVRGTYNLHGTETGRLSSSKPNMQNIPRNKLIKNIYVARKGYKLVQLDYSQAELRCLAVLSNDPWLKQVYLDDGDLHDAVALEMFGEGFDKEDRNMAKTINFGIAYGRGPSSIAEKFGKSMSEARDIIARWFKPMPLVEKFIQDRRRMATKGEPCISIFGRERHFVITNEDLNHIQNEYINTPIQSMASDLTMFCVIEIHNWIESNISTFKFNSGDVKLVATVHDSIILEVKDEHVDFVAERCKDIMATTPAEYIPDLDVPFRADVEVGVKWGELEKWQKSI